MKKILLLLFTFILCFSIGTSAYAAEIENNNTEVSTIENASQPRLMVTSYKIENDDLSPNDNSNVEITIKNFSKTKEVNNIKLSLVEEKGDIKADGMPTKYVDKIKAGGTYTWKLKLTASKTAEIGEHAVNVTMEYEDSNFTPYSASDTIRINVKQSVGLDYDGAILPNKVIQDDTITLTLNFMNTGKSLIRNCKAEFEIDGLQSGGCLFTGEIPTGESKSGTSNLRVDSSMLGDIAGKITISYEDEFGESYSKVVDVSSKIEKKVVKSAEDEEKEKEKPNKLWWLFTLIGLAVGGGIGCSIPLIITANKNRKLDEERL